MTRNHAIFSFRIFLACSIVALHYQHHHHRYLHHHTQPETNFISHTIGSECILYIPQHKKLKNKKFSTCWIHFRLLLYAYAAWNDRNGHTQNFNTMFVSNMPAPLQIMLVFERMWKTMVDTYFMPHKHGNKIVN